MAFKHGITVKDDDIVEAYFIKPDQIETAVYDCPFHANRARMSLRGMETCTPQAVAMKVYGDPNDLNRELAQYVKQYVAKLTF
jgi:hypothetical protein